MRRILFITFLMLINAGQSPADDILFSNLGQPDNGGVKFNNAKVRFATDFLTDIRTRARKTHPSALITCNNSLNSPDAFFSQIRTYDISTLALVAIVLGVAALLASYIPAHRAASINPVEALRAE